MLLGGLTLSSHSLSIASSLLLATSILFTAFYARRFFGLPTIRPGIHATLVTAPFTASTVFILKRYSTISASFTLFSQLILLVAFTFALAILAASLYRRKSATKTKIFATGWCIFTICFGFYAFQDVLSSTEDSLSHTVLNIGILTESLLGGFAITVGIKSRQDQLTYKLKAHEEELEDLVRLRTKELIEANKIITQLSLVDELTGVANRRQFNQRLDQEWKSLRRRNEPISIILCDVDYFKTYNDHYGHGDGDIVLSRVALALKDVIRRPDDLLARYGGEEFVYLLPGTGIEDANKLAESARKAIESLAIPHQFSSISTIITISAGVSCATPNATNNRKSLIDSADAALYKAKAAGRNRVETMDYSDKPSLPKPGVIKKRL